MEIVVRESHFKLLPQRAVFWKEQSALILSDLHFGKTTHFRKSGIPIPEQAAKSDLQTLDELIKNFNPASLIIVGDMFHSEHNGEVEQFASWRKTKPRLQINLVAGNHDILGEEKYKELGLQVCETLNIESFTFSHQLTPSYKTFCFTGHLHPGVRIEGAARQSLRLPCFHFTNSSCTLPAFSKFTGLAIIEPSKDDSVFAIVGEEVVQFKLNVSNPL